MRILELFSLFLVCFLVFGQSPPVPDIVKPKYQETFQHRNVETISFKIDISELKPSHDFIFSAKTHADSKVQAFISLTKPHSRTSSDVEYSFGEEKGGNIFIENEKLDRKSVV